MTDLTDPAAVEGLLAGTTEGEWRVPSRAYWDLLGIDYVNLYAETTTDHTTIATRLGEIAKYEDAAFIAQAPALARAHALALRELGRLREAIIGTCKLHRCSNWPDEVRELWQAAHEIRAALHPAPEVPP